MSFNDHFSGHAATYAAARPDYPEQLFAYLARECTEHDLALDCATGNGQAAVALLAYFAKVVATDASAEQLQQAPQHERIEYQCSQAEAQVLPADSVDLITVAQALHWFDLARFFSCAGAMLKPGGLLAIWSYGIHQVNPGVDEICGHYYRDIVGEYWPLQRQLVETAYRDIEFPFPLLSTPEFAMTRRWSLTELRAYLESWSATQYFRKARAEDPLLLIDTDLRRAWGDVERQQVSWPLTLKLGRKP